MPYYATDRVFFTLVFGIPMVLAIIRCEVHIHFSK